MQREPPKNSQSKSSKTIGFLQKKQRFPAKKNCIHYKSTQMSPNYPFFFCLKSRFVDRPMKVDHPGILVVGGASFGRSWAMTWLDQGRNMWRNPTKCAFNFNQKCPFIQRRHVFNKQKWGFNRIWPDQERTDYIRLLHSLYHCIMGIEGGFKQQTWELNRNNCYNIYIHGKTLVKGSLMCY